ncbi:hypothetical protein NB640_12115 [Oxalobacter vibrioformis]|uniref:Uncharacterized protein n=1 Tax=Oxalobacter vibrioformis TaxID=933080 RepID=A0A9E9LW59_9BURK|nr:hypothetical protein [Oxalobacter vibrioformis]WAW09949.1 hypothetical protein NB640_12115 [Oxalobacter vibrioformis]
MLSPVTLFYRQISEKEKRLASRREGKKNRLKNGKKGERKVILLTSKFPGLALQYGNKNKPEMLNLIIFIQVLRGTDATDRKKCHPQK